MVRTAFPNPYEDEQFEKLVRLLKPNKDEDEDTLFIRDFLRPGPGLYAPTGSYLSLPGTAGNYASTPDSAAVSITGDIDIRVKVALDDWTPASGVPDLFAKDSAANTSWKLEVMSADLPPAGRLNLQTSADGTAGINHFSTELVGSADESVKWVRATIDVDNGAAGHDVKFYTSDDGITWIQLGTTVTTAGTTSIFDGTADVGVGQAGTPAGKFYYAELRNGIDGPVVAKFDPSEAADNAASFTASTGEIWTINKSGAPDARIVRL